ncbi:MAG: hypothetical protein AAF171_21030 [Cyanobacteria bacterium P01_A01_bin.116]
MNQTVLPQLQEIEAELASQEEQLNAQLAEIQDKLNGIRAVLPMFSDSSETPATATSSKTTKTTATSGRKPARKKAATKAKATKTAAKATANKTKKSTLKASTASKASKTEKKDGRTADWQKYVRPGVDQKSIPEAVLLILQTQPNQSFKIIDMMTAIFEDDMPRDQYLKARNRISNLLSGGVREGKWYRGERSTYRLNK